MNKIILIVVAVVVLGFGALLIFGEKSDSNSSSEQVEAAMTFASVQSDVNAGALFLDVRTPEEFTDSHFANAVNMPVTDIQAGKMPDASKDTTLYVYCRSGNRSAQAKTALEAAGYTDVVDLGGLTDVEEMGGTLQ